MAHFDLYRAIACKYSQPLMDFAYSLCVDNDDAVTPALFRDFCQQMKNRLGVGECRYEGAAWAYYDRDQEETIGKGWRYGFTFFDWNPEDFERALRRKADAYGRSGNTELLVDVANYWAFLELTTDRPVAGWKIAQVLREFASPTHPKAHYRKMDQGIDGTDASGSASVLPGAVAKLRNFAR